MQKCYYVTLVPFHAKINKKKMELPEVFSERDSTVSFFSLMTVLSFVNIVPLFPP